MHFSRLFFFGGSIFRKWSCRFVTFCTGHSRHSELTGGNEAVCVGEFYCNLSTNHLNATISGNDSYPVMLLEDHGRYMMRFADCVFPSLFGLCRLAIYPAIAFTAQP